MATPPREVVPGRNIELSRRTHGRMLALLPTALIRQTILYLLALCAERHGVTLYAMVVMFNHYHLLANDADGAFPAFMMDFNSMLARALNAILGRDDSLWSADGYQPLFPQSAASVLDRLRYIYGNPLEANLVSRLADYPHLLIRPEDIGRDMVVRRPDHPFFNNGGQPAEVRVRFDQPPEFGEMELGAYQSMLEGIIAEEESAHRERREREGLSVLGRKRLLGHRDWRRTPQSREKWFRMRPQIAERAKALRVAAIQSMKDFRERYKKALKRYNEGEHYVEFPFGTWGMRKHNVCIAEKPPSR